MSETTDAAFLWLNKRRDPRGYSGDEAREYVFDRTVGGWKRLVPGAKFVYYRPRERTLIGAGLVDRVEQVDGGFGKRSRAIIRNYRPFVPPVPAVQVKDKVAFLRGRPGLRGVPQNSVSYLSAEEYSAILAVAQAVQQHAES